MLKRIAIIGPESTGKTWLANKLAEHFKTEYVEEFARSYFDYKDYSYSVDDLVEIGIRQLKNEDALASTCNKIVFCDTDFIVLKIWSEIVFGFVPDWIEHKVSTHIYDLYLLCNTDVAWVNDPLRNNKHNRKHIYNMFETELQKNNLNYRVVKDTGERRFYNAIDFVNEIYNYEK